MLIYLAFCIKYCFKILTHIARFNFWLTNHFFPKLLLVRAVLRSRNVLFTGLGSTFVIQILL